MRLHCGSVDASRTSPVLTGKLQSDPEAHILGGSTHRSGRRGLNLNVIPGVRSWGSQTQRHLISWSIGVQADRASVGVAHRDPWVIFQVFPNAR